MSPTAVSSYQQHSVAGWKKIETGLSIRNPEPEVRTTTEERPFNTQRKCETPRDINSQAFAGHQKDKENLVVDVSQMPPEKANCKRLLREERTIFPFQSSWRKEPRRPQAPKLHGTCFRRDEWRTALRGMNVVSREIRNVRLTSERRLPELVSQACGYSLRLNNTVMKSPHDWCIICPGH